MNNTYIYKKNIRHIADFTKLREFADMSAAQVDTFYEIKNSYYCRVLSYIQCVL